MNVRTGLQFRFPDHATAGRALAPLLDEYAGSANLLVLALVKGGVLAAIEVAGYLGAPLDVIVKKRVLLPHGAAGPPTALTSVAGNRLIPEEVSRRAAAPVEGMDFSFADAIAEFLGADESCRGAKPARDVTGKDVIVVDNGVRSGETVSIAVRALRTLSAGRVTIAVPVGAATLRNETFGADRLFCLRWEEGLNNVAMAYQNFDVPRIESIGALLEREAAWNR